jgi:hypothetical protein
MTKHQCLFCVFYKMLFDKLTVKPNSSESVTRRSNTLDRFGFNNNFFSALSVRITKSVEPLSNDCPP